MNMWIIFNKFLIDYIDGNKVEDISVESFNDKYSGKVVYLTGAEFNSLGKLVRPLYGYPVVVKNLHYQKEDSGLELYFLQFEHMKKKPDFYNKVIKKDLEEVGIKNKKYDNDVTNSQAGNGGDISITTSEDLNGIRDDYNHIVKSVEDIILGDMVRKYRNLKPHLGNDIVKEDNLNLNILNEIPELEKYFEIKQEELYSKFNSEYIEYRRNI